MADYSITGDTRIDTSGFTSGVNAMTIAAGSMIASFVQSAASTISGLGKAAIDQGAALEQSIGGVETLFGDAAATVMANADKAYQTAGLSANSYMEQATSFAAALLSSLNGNVEAAAEAADMALVDMSDNANKMGTSLGSIQDAYQGFAKQNYTMLDNLKLGYGGTKTEMERLLSDAQEISGVEYDISSLSDVYNAIHVIQQELGITGTTAEEAATTISGSAGSMDAAFENLLANLTLGEDIQPSLEALVESVTTYLTGNLIPAIENIMAGFPDILINLWPDFINTGMDLVSTLAVDLLDAGTDLMQSLADGFTEGVPDFLSEVLPKILSITEELREHFGDFVTAGVDMVLQLATGLVNALPELFAYIPDIVINIAGLINDNAPKLLAGGVALIVKLIEGIIKAIPQLIANLPKVIQAIVSVLSAFNWINLGGSILKGIANGIKSMTGSITAAMQSGFSGALTWLKNLPSQALSWGKNVIKSFINGVRGVDVATTLAAEMTTIAETAYNESNELYDTTLEVADKSEVNALKMENISKSAAKSADDATDSADKATKSASTATSAATTAATATASVVESLTDTATTTADGIEKTVKTVTETLSDGTTRQKKTITETGTEIVDGVEKTFEKVTTIAADGSETVSKTLKEITPTVTKTVTDTATQTVDGIEATVKTVTKTLSDGTETQQQTITKSENQLIDGAWKTVETVTTISEDGVETVSQTISDGEPQFTSAAELLVYQFKNKLNDSWEEIDNAIKTDAMGSIQTLTDAIMDGDIEQLATWAAAYFWNACNAEQKAQIQTVAMGALSQLEGALSGTFSSLSSLATALIAQFVPAVAGATTGQTALNVAMDANPILLVVSLIGMLVGALISFAKQNKSVANAFKKIWYAVCDGVSIAFELVLRAFGSLVQGAINGINVIIAGLNLIPGVNIGYIKNPIYNWADQVAAKRKANQQQRAEEDAKADHDEGLADGSIYLVKQVTDTTTQMIDGLEATVKTVTKTYSDGVVETAKQITTTEEKLVDGVLKTIKTVRSIDEDGIETIAQTIEDATASGASDGIKDTITDATDAVTDAVTDNTAALLTANAALADLVKQADGLVLSDNMAIGSTVLASGTSQVAAAAKGYYSAGATNITQNIYSKAQTAADLARETRWEADRAKSRRR